MKSKTLGLYIAMAAFLFGGTPVLVAEDNSLRVDKSGRFLLSSEDIPFFYLGDTAWELFHRLNREEAIQYLDNRKKKGFNVIQACLLAELDGLSDPNAYGHVPLTDNDPMQPSEISGPENDYWDHVDFVVDEAGNRELFMGLLPTWGDKWQAGTGVGPHVFNKDNAEGYGQWLGKRYKDKPIIWILGGDRNIYSDKDREIIDAMAKGLRKGDGGSHLITYHPRGPGRSSDYFHKSDWLDFNMFQSSHGARDHDNGLFSKHDYALTPAKPTLDGEPRYEALQVGFYNRDATGQLYFDDYDVRQAAYWSLLAGACGHTYGNGSVWQMWDDGRKAQLGCKIPWQVAIDHPGSFQMGHLKTLFTSRPFEKLIPNEQFLVDGPNRGGTKVRGALASDGSFAFVYSPRGEQFSVELNVFGDAKVRAAWFDPRYGVSHELHTSDAAGIQSFVPPSSGRGQDWILILDNMNYDFALPTVSGASF